MKRTALIGLLILVSGCASQPDARVQNMLNERGFGTPYVGNVNEQYYLGIGDRFAITDRGHPEVSAQFIVAPDGVIHVGLINEDIHVAGLTLPDVSELLTRRYREFIESAQIEVQLTGSNSKYFYIHGEVAGEGRVPFTGGHNLFDVLFQARPTILADDDNVRLIRADPVHPLVAKFDYNDMAFSGLSGRNYQINENDIIYVPPNLLGVVAMIIEGALAPLNRVVAGALSVNRLLVLGDSFTSDNRFIGGGFGGRRGGGRRRFGGFGFGDFYGEPVEAATAPADGETP